MSREQLLQLVKYLKAHDISNNPDPNALYTVGCFGFTIWCTPDDCPKGYELITMTTGAFAKPCAFVGEVQYRFRNDEIVELILTTDASDLNNRKGPGYPDVKKTRNRKVDISWARIKLAQIFCNLPFAMPPIQYSCKS
jgi:hypothetical protein